MIRQFRLHVVSELSSRRSATAARSERSQLRRAGGCALTGEVGLAALEQPGELGIRVEGGAGLLLLPALSLLGLLGRLLLELLGPELALLLV